MKRVRINKGKVGVVTRFGDYRKTITSGVSWVGIFDKVSLYDKSKFYTSTTDLNIMLEDENFKSLIQLIEIKDNEIALKFVENNFDSILTSGRYFYWKGLLNFDIKIFNTNSKEQITEIDPSILNYDVVKGLVRTFTVEKSEEALLFVNGEFKEKLSNGVYYFWKNSTPIDVVKLDTRQQQLEISGQEILTKDKTNLRINFYLQYKINDVKKLILDIKDYEKQIYILSQLSLREYVGSMTLDEILEKKESISGSIKEELSEKMSKIGISLIELGIRDIILPGDVKEIMNQVLIAQKKAQANIIKRREETASTRNLLNTAKLMEENNMLYKLKEMEYIEVIAEKVGEITVSGGGKILDQLKEIFTNK